MKKDSKPRVPPFYEKLMVVVGIGGQLALYIQAYHIFSRESSEDVSLIAYLCALFSLTCWLIYGLFLRDRALIIANAVAVVGSILVIAGILKYSYL